VILIAWGVRLDLWLAIIVWGSQKNIFWDKTQAKYKTQPAALRPSAT